MTLKHIDFYDSPVMRELARQEVKKGTVAPDLSTMVKMAKAKKGDSYAPSGDLFADMVRLADGLRSKGYVKDADVLEKKILAYKSAQAELDEALLDEAHPEGDVEVADAEDELGVLETIPTLHDRVMTMVEKEPSPKQAMVSNVLKIAESILKNAQAASPKANSQARQGRPSLEEMESEVLGIDAEKIQDINRTIAEGFSDAHGFLTKALAEIDYDKWKFHPQELLTNDQLLAAYSSKFQNSGEIVKADKTNIEHCKTLFGKFRYPGDIYPMIVETLKSKLTQPDQMRALVSRVSPDLMGYVTGLAEQNDEQQYNPNSIWEYAWPTKMLVVVPKNFNQLVNAMYNQLRNLYLSALGDDKLTAATNMITSEAEKILAPLRATVAELGGEPPQLSQNAKSAAVAISKISRYGTTLQNFSSNGSEAKKLMKITNELWPGWTPAIVSVSDMAIGRIRELVAYVNEKAINPGDVLLTEDMVAQVVGTFSGAIQNLINAAKSVAKDSEDYKKYDRLAGLAFEARKIVEGHVGKTFFGLSQALAGILPVKNFNELVGKASAILSNTANLVTTTPTDETSADDGLVATAASSLDELAGGAAKPAAAPSKPGGAPAPAGGAPLPGAKLQGGRIMGKLTDAEKAEVIKMQQLLVDLGKLKNKPEWQKVGKDGAPKPDGAWGPGTAGILADIQKEMSAAGVKGTLHTGPPGAGWAGRQKTSQLAQENCKLLQEYLDKLGGNKAPEKTNFAVGTIPQLNNVTLYMQDLGSLAGLYDMFMRAGAQEVGGVTANNETFLGIPYGHFMQYMHRTWGTIRGWYNSNPKNTASYYQAMNARMKEMLETATQFSLDPQNPESVISKAMFNAAGAGSEQGAAYLDPTTGKPARRPGGAGGKGQPVGEGTDQALAEDAPMPFVNQGDIDLSMTEYYGPVTRMVGEQMLVLRIFGGRGARELAYALFEGEKADVRLAFQRFLNQLGKSINSAVRRWARDTQPLQAQRANAFRWMTIWAEEIARLKDDNKTWPGE